MRALGLYLFWKEKRKTEFGLQIGFLFVVIELSGKFRCVYDFSD